MEKSGVMVNIDKTLCSEPKTFNFSILKKLAQKFS